MPQDSAFNIPHSPIAALGTIVLLVAFVVAAYAAATGLIGNAQHRRRLVTSSVYSLYAFFALMLLASALIIYAFVTHDYTIKYVAQYSDTSMPLWYKITAYWGGLDGSLMFWVSVLAAFSAIAVRSNHARHRDMIGYVVAVVMIVQLFFLALLIYNKNPFATFLTEPPVDGKGLNPLLQNYWMVIHPPSLYVGFVAATIPFAFGIAALASGRLDDKWLGSVRNWTLICWFFLSLGLILGGRWAYEELGWGGYWAWDPVENAGLLPWFTMTAFLHAVMIQEQRGMMKVWNVVLVITSFFLTIFGTFMTRSGVVQSVHSFGEDNELALMFILFMALILIVSMGLLVFRLPRLRSSNAFESFVSREYAFLLNNWILLACAFFVLFATMFPTISEAVNGHRITVGPPFFNKWMIPMGLILLFLAGATPLLAWRRTTRDRLLSQFLFPVAFGFAAMAALAIFVPRTLVFTTIFSDSIELPVSLVNFGLVAFTFGSVGQEFWRGVRVRMRQTGSSPLTSLIGLVVSKRRKYGGYVVHVAVAVMFLGFAGKAYETMHDHTLPGPNQEFSVRDYTFRYDALETTSDDHKHAITAQVTLLHDGEEVGQLRPAKWQFTKMPDQPTTEVAIDSSLADDVYIVLTGYDTQSERANFRVYINPLINWVWIGFGLLVLGTAICLLPQRLAGGLSPRGGGGGSAALALVFAGAALFAAPGVARAQSGPAGGAMPQVGEHESGSAHSKRNGAAHLFRPHDTRFLGQFAERVRQQLRAENPDIGKEELESKVAAAVAPIEELARTLMHDLVCLCGGCERLTLYGCDCPHAARDRRKVLTMLSEYDLLDPKVRDRAYDEIVESFISEYGGEHVLTIPADEGFNRLAWMVPYGALAGALVLIFGVGRRWVKRQPPGGGSGGGGDAGLSEDEETYAELLDDELRDTD